MRLFYVEQAVPQAVVLSWVNQASYGEKAKESSSALSELGIWKDTAMPGGKCIFSSKINRNTCLFNANQLDSGAALGLKNGCCLLFPIS